MEEAIAVAFANRDAAACTALCIESLKQGWNETARRAIEHSIQLQADISDAWNLYGIVLRRLGNLELALNAYAQAVKLDPAFGEAWNNQGVTLQQLGQLTEAIQAYQRAAQVDPNIAEAHSNLANVLHSLGRSTEAWQWCQRALTINPRSAETWILLGRIHLAQLALAEANQAFHQAIRLDPSSAKAFYYHGLTLEICGQATDALTAFQRAYDLQPDFLAALDGCVHQRQHLCLWNGMDALAKCLVDAVEEQVLEFVPPDHRDLISPFSFLCLPIETTPAQQWRCARRWATSLGKPVALKKTSRPQVRIHPAKLQIGYLSADFHTHATAALIGELIERHDRGRFRVIGYSYGPDDHSDMRRRFERAFDHFVDLSALSYAAAAARIHQDQTDILIDLKGYTQFARPQILAYRPAPIQISYLGYPGTLGADFIDYVIADEFLVPAPRASASPTSVPGFSESVIRLPGCYQVNDSRWSQIEDAKSRKEYGLPVEAFVYCCFNSHYKITESMFSLWMRLLHSQSDSVLWLLSGHPTGESNLRRYAEQRGIDPRRLIFAPRLPMPQHLARHQAADLFLDTFPVNAHTGASDALRSGLPLLTQTGQTMVSRVAGSLLHTLDLPMLIARTGSEYEELARMYASDRQRLAEVRSMLQATIIDHPLFSGEAFRQKIEAIYLDIWQTRTE